MKADLLGFERLAHLDYMPLPGGEQAVHQPWRMAAANLAQAYGEAFSELDIPFVKHLDYSKVARACTNDCATDQLPANFQPWPLV